MPLDLPSQGTTKSSLGSGNLPAGENPHSLDEDAKGLDGDLLAEECLRSLSFFIAHRDTAATTSVPVKMRDMQQWNQAMEAHEALKLTSLGICKHSLNHSLTKALPDPFCPWSRFWLASSKMAQSPACCLEVLQFFC